MNEYRKSIPLNHETDYWFVEMGAIPGMPLWHKELYKFSSYAFPSYEAARRFAFGARDRDWKRDVAIRFPDGTREEIPLV